MKIKIAPANKRKKLTKVEKSMEEIVEEFLNGPVKDAIDSADGCNVNVETPSGIYNDMDKFYRLCKEALEPLGYVASRSHDGGGMYDTLWVTWKKEVKKVDPAIPARYVYTVVRNFEFFESELEDQLNTFRFIEDESDEYLYGGSGMTETIEVKMEVNRGNGWEIMSYHPYTPKKA